MAQKNISWPLVLSIIFLHFMIVRMAGFPLTIVPFAISIFLYFHVKTAIKPRGLLLGGALLIWPICVYVMYEMLGGSADLTEFSKTYLLWVYAISAIILISFAPLKRTINYSFEFLIALVVITVFSLAQILFFKLLGSTLLYNPFGAYTYMGEYQIERFSGDEYSRAPGFYLEPSFCAFVIFFLTAAILISNDKNRAFNWLLAFSLLSVVITGSASGMIAIPSLIIVRAIAILKSKLLKLILVFVTPVLIVIFGEIFLSHRVEEIAVEGSSGYWRLVAPLIILTKVFAEYPLGVPFGQIEAFLLPLGLQHGTNTGTSIDNGVYYLAFYFGWFVVPFVAGLLYKFLQSMFRGDVTGVTYWWFILFSLQFSGGVLLPEYIFPLLLITMQYRRIVHLKNNWFAQPFESNGK